jgi:HTH-type transcriptional regulator / antitoxin HigA
MEASMKNELVPAEVFPPGEFLGEELEEHGWSQAEFAEILGRPAAAVSEIINGKRAITPSTAKELAAALGTSPILWMNLEAAYRLHQTEEPPGRIAIEAKLRSAYPVRDMIQRGWIEHSETPEVLESRVLQFFGVESLDQPPELPHAARKGAKLDGYDESSPSQLAWLYRVKQMAEAQQVPLYAPSKLREALRELRSLMIAPEEARHVPRILTEAGVRFVVVEYLPGSKIDGVCFWLNENQPVIGMSLRLDRIDNFWFVLRHEIEHVLNEDASLDNDLSLDAPHVSAQEHAANKAAAGFGVPSHVVDDFIARKSPLFSRNRIQDFAKIVGIHPGIVVGQLQHRLDRWDLHRRLLVKIRQHVVPSASTDGYRHVATV